MGYFRYKVIRSDGSLSGGVVQLPFVSTAAAHEYFERRGGTVVSISQVGRLVAQVIEIGENRLGRRIGRNDLIEFLNNLAIMLRSGIPIMVALAESITLAENRALIRTVEHIQLSVEAGLSFADAVDQHRKVFPDTIRKLVRIGEETGTLDRTLRDGADHLGRIRQIKADTTRSLIYPTFVFLTTLGAGLFWVFYVVPQIEDLFIQMQLPLPELTVWLLDATDFINANSRWIGLAVAAIAVLTVLAIRHNPKARYAYHVFLLKAPIIGRIQQASGLAFIAEYFSLFARSGVDILQSLRTLEDAVLNDVYRSRLIQIREGLERGSSLSAEFRRAGVFPSFVVRMINIGEQTGNLAEQLGYIAEEYRRRLANIVENIAEIIKPLAMLLVGGFFIIIVVGLFLPIYQLIGKIGVGRF